MVGALTGFCLGGTLFRRAMLRNWSYTCAAVQQNKQYGWQLSYSRRDYFFDEKGVPHS